MMNNLSPGMEDEGCIQSLVLSGDAGGQVVRGTSWLQMHAEGSATRGAGFAPAARGCGWAELKKDVL